MMIFQEVILVLRQPRTLPLGQERQCACPRATFKSGISIFCKAFQYNEEYLSGCECIIKEGNGHSS